VEEHKPVVELGDHGVRAGLLKPSGSPKSISSVLTMAESFPSRCHYKLLAAINFS
jgi:hypothetical protein